VAQTKHEIQDLLSQANSSPRHRFGQNFMIDQNLVRVIADAGQLTPDELAIEVGPGTGTLTEELLTRAGTVVAVEIDRDLAALLRTRLRDHPKFRLIEGDALAGKHELNRELRATIDEAHVGKRPAKLVANLPYNIASPLIIELLIAGVDLLAFTVQKEVADRLKGKPGHDDYGVLTVMAQMLSGVEVLRTMPPQAFWPPPKIDSALVRMTRRDRLGPDAAPFSTFLQKIFSARRKMLRKALANATPDADRLLAEAGLDPRARPEEVPPEELWRLYQLSRDRRGKEFSVETSIARKQSAS
jgi:16S rRNA (adenine1518-N6/adenine1519-N6)-dimethyltransferase